MSARTLANTFRSRVVAARYARIGRSCIAIVCLRRLRHATMSVLRPIFCLILLVAGIEPARAQIVLPSDVGVTMTASPSTNLQPGQPIDVALTVTNNGPADVPILFLTSAVYVDELSIVFVNAAECYFNLLVIDLSNGMEEYQLEWDLAGPVGVLPPFPVGEATCHFQIALTSNAPSPYNFSFGLQSSYESDSNPANDRATVMLQRGPPPPPPTPLPALSVAMLCWLAALSAAIGAFALRRQHHPNPVRS